MRIATMKGAMSLETNPVIERARVELATRRFDQGFHWRILFIGRSVNGSTDIVSCLSRSLRNLGHRVLDIDLKRHRDLTDNPSRARGGNGPIYIHADALDPMLERFRPQMIVCCAGGLTFRPDDAEQLKRKGIVLVGLTLSDPDVFPTVHEHARVFDFHTTNARAAMTMYRDAGVLNTLYFPFGIDRGFVTQSVPPAPELAADVICIGHASARPERNGIMSRVARDLDVRTYGRGWELPGSEVVEGRRMVQASRHGRVHVNFPLTRAGYLNIKCGIFESAGSGALIATGRFKEMEDFFSYDDEIIGYRDEDDLVDQVRSVLADPERYKRMTERTFDRLINQHLYEHRWMALFDEMLSIIRAGGAWLGTERTQEVLNILGQSLHRTRYVVISGFYGASNVGDELILRSISERIEAADPSAQVWVAAENPEQVERNHGLQSFPRKSLADALHAIRTASAVVLGGGGLWHDYTFDRSGGLQGLFQNPQISIAGFGALPLMGRMFDIPFHVVGMGIGPLSDPDAKRMARFLARDADSIMVRDAESAALAAEVCPYPDRVTQAPDTVYALDLQPRPEPEEVAAFRAKGYRIVGLNLRPWAHTDEQALVDNIAGALAHAAARHPIAVVGIPMQAGQGIDSRMLSAVALKLGDDVPAVVLRSPLTADQLTATLASLDVLVSMRLHACLLAHRLGRPVVGIAYDPKVANHFSELDRSNFCLQLPLDRGILDAAIAEALSAGNVLPETTLARLAALEREAATALDVFARRVADAPDREVLFEVPRVNAAPPPKASPAAIGLKASGPSSSYVDMSFIMTGSISAPSASSVSTSSKLSVWLPADAPAEGDGMIARGVIEIHGQGDVELSMALASPYENPRALRRVRYELEVGGCHRISEDLAANATPIQLRVFTKAPARIPVTLSVKVERTCFPSRAWPRASQVELRLVSTVQAEHGCGLRMFSSRGIIESVQPSSGKQAAEDRKAQDGSHA